MGWSSYYVYALIALPIILTPFNQKNWYTIMTTTVGFIFSFIPRALYRKFHLSGGNVTLLNYTVVLLTLIGDVYALMELSFNLMNFFGDQTLLDIVSDSRFCSGATLIRSIVDLTIFICVIALSLSRLVILTFPFWYSARDPKQMAAGVFIFVIGGSIIINLTGYRLIAGDYCEPGLFERVYFFQRGFKINTLEITGTNYPEFKFAICLAVVLHLFSITLEWKIKIYDNLSISMKIENNDNRIHPAGDQEEAAGRQHQGLRPNNEIWSSPRRIQLGIAHGTKMPNVPDEEMITNQSGIEYNNSGVYVIGIEQGCFQQDGNQRLTKNTSDDLELVPWSPSNLWLGIHWRLYIINTGNSKKS